MIVLHRLFLQNFLSHKISTINFSDNEKLLIDGASGSGKSAIVEAIIWALYGVGRVDNRNLVYRGEKTATVILEVKEGDKIYRIKRSTTDKATNKLEVTESTDGETFSHIGRAGIRDIQEWIETELLHASYDLFTNSVVYLQDNPNTFVRQNAGKRKELLLEILRVGQYGELYKKATERLNREIGVQTKIEAEISARKEVIEALSRSIVDKVSAEKELASVDADLFTVEKTLTKLKISVKTLGLLSEQENKLSYELKAQKDKSITYIRDITLTKKELEVFGTYAGRIAFLKEIVDRVEKDTDQRAELKEKLEQDTLRQYRMSALMTNKPKEVDYDWKIAQVERQIDPLKNDSKECPSGDECPYTKPILGQIEYLEKEIEKYREEKKQMEKSIAEYVKDLESLSTPLLSPEQKKLLAHLDSDAIAAHRAAGEIKQLEEMSSGKTEAGFLEKLSVLEDLLKESDVTVNYINGKLTELISEINSIKSTGNDLEWLVTKAEMDIKDLQHKKTRIQSDIESAEKTANMIKENEKNIDSCTTQLAEVNSNIDSLGAVKEAFSQRGIPAVVIDYVIPRLEEKVNEILGQLSEFKIRIDTQRKNSSGDGMVEGLFLNIYNESGEEFDFDSYSGGQKLKINIAIAEALASLQKVGFRIYDEAVVMLDENSEESFMGVLDTLQNKFPQVIFISHVRAIKDMFNTSITVSKRAGISIID